MLRLLEMLDMSPGYPCPSHHLLLRAVLQRVTLDHAKLLAAQPICSISQISQTCQHVGPVFFVKYLENILGKPLCALCMSRHLQLFNRRTLSLDTIASFNNSSSNVSHAKLELGLFSSFEFILVEVSQKAFLDTL